MHSFVREAWRLIVFQEMYVSSVEPEFPPVRGLNPKGASRFIGMSESWLSKARMGITDHPGPAFKKIGRKVLYTQDALETWLDS